ncbi:MAG: hypothetical protein ACE5R4_18250 [Armatimonadota bacterium]
MPEEQEAPVGRLVGKVSHFFPHPVVAAIELTDTLKVGDTIHIKGATSDFTQTVESMQIEHEQVEQAGPGDSIGVKVVERAREGDEVYVI